MSTIVISSVLPRVYDYSIRYFTIVNGSLQQSPRIPIQRIAAREINQQTVNHWWIYLAANYHDSFYFSSYDPTKAIPTQVTGAVGEALSIIIMQRVFQAMNILPITPYPSSKSADFQMDIIESGQRVHALVESKGSNSQLNWPPRQTVSQGILQLLETRRLHPANSGYLIITSYPSNTCFVIKVF